MGNESSKKSGFYTPPPPLPNSTNNITYDINSTYFNNDINNMLSEIASEIDDQYHNKSIHTIDKQITNHKKKGHNQDKSDSITNSVSLSFVAASNIINNISDIFTYKKQLGVGASCRVLLVNDPKTNREYALKELQKHNKMNKLLFATEYKILNELNGGKNILSYYSSYIDKHCYYLAFEYHSGGTMLEHILEQGSFCELECAEFIKNVLHGLKYMHDKNVVHRDIKCENLIFDKKGKDGIVKIIDFGNSELIVNPNQLDNKIVGSLHYLPPELLFSKKRMKKTLYKGDMWAIGVVCYILVTGKVPFYGDNQFETLNAIRKAIFIWPKKETINLSDSCIHFISRLLCIDINKRMDCNDALSHEWISTKGKALDTMFGNQHLDAIEIFSKTNKLQKILVSCVLNDMEKKEKKILLKALRDLNMNGNNSEINQNHIINYVLMYEQLFVNSNDNNNKLQTKTNNKNNISISIKDIDIEAILKEIDEIDAMDCNTKYKFAMLEDSDDEKLLTDNDDENDYDLQLEFQQIERHKLNFFDFSSAQSIDSDININDEYETKEKMTNHFKNSSLIYSDPKTKISIERFSEIIGRADKEYDVASLVNKLQPTASGNIPLKHINGFNGTLHSKESNKKAMYHIMKKGLTTIDSIVDDDTQNWSFIHKD